jgi:hypothetical protein
MAPFQYQPFVDRYGGTIADLMLRRGDVIARGAQAQGEAQAAGVAGSGAAWAHGIQSAAQQVGQLPAEIQRAKASEIAIGNAQQEHDIRQKQIDDLKALDAAYQQPGGREAILNALPGHLKASAAQTFEAMDKAHAETQKLRDEADVRDVETMADLGAAVRDHGYDPIAAQLAISDQRLKAAGNPSRLQQIDQAEQRLHADPTPETVKSIVDPLINASPKRRAEAAAAATLQRQTARDAQLAANEDRTRTATEARDAAAQANNEALRAQGDRRLTIEQQQADTAAARERRERAQSVNDHTDLSPAGLDAAALNYAKTGILPPLGMGDKGTRKQIINRAAEMMPGLDLASAKADYTANQGALTQLTKQREAIGAFETTARKNIDLFLQTAGKVVDTGSPFLNLPLRKLSGAMLGSPDQAAFDAARQVAVNEVAKIVSNPTLSGTLSDSARHEVDAFNPENATLKQAVSVMRLLRQDMDNRTAALDDQIAGIKARIAKGGPQTSQKITVQTPAGAFTFDSQEKADAFKKAAGLP